MKARKPFRLQGVLRYRQQVEKQLKGELTRLTQALAEAESIRLRQFQQWESCCQTLHITQQAGLAATDLFLYSAFLQRLSTEMRQQDQAIEGLHQAVERTRERLEQAMRDRKILENLQQKFAFQRHKEDLRDEERTLAEMALRRFAHE